jgi:hypothetical protein
VAKWKHLASFCLARRRGPRLHIQLYLVCPATTAPRISWACKGRYTVGFAHDPENRFRGSCAVAGGGTIVGAIVGEHTYNVDAYDRLQTYYVKAISYLSSKLSFAYEGEDITDFVQRPQFQECAGKSDSYALWECREQVWNRSFRGKTVGGESFPDDRFGATFFQPYYAGQTFGLGQLNPLTALQMSDLVHQVSGLPKLDVGDPNAVYKTIMDPDLTLDYVAATIRKSIDAYQSIAGFDISGNPGITSTLYNVGNPEQRAHALKAENDRRRDAGEPEKLPEENYYGWLVNDKLPELKALF